ncbi:MAG: DNA polymerase IV, partial [Parvibaculum sp.]|nr:DNA polymerase IV [Parvibaculum sp.]
FRLLGVGISGLTDGDLSDPPDFLDPGAARRAAAERAMDRLRDKFGDKSIGKGRGLRK